MKYLHRVKRLWLVSLLLLSGTAAYATKPTPNPADYTINVHVIGSANRDDTQHLEAVINGQTVELVSINGFYHGVLELGDYKAKYFNAAPKTHTSYDHWDNYEIYFPQDGAIRMYSVITIGAPPPTCDTSDAQPSQNPQ